MGQLSDLIFDLKEYTSHDTWLHISLTEKNVLTHIKSGRRKILWNKDILLVSHTNIILIIMNVLSAQFILEK